MDVVPIHLQTLPAAATDVARCHSRPRRWMTLTRSAVVGDGQLLAARCRVHLLRIEVLRRVRALLLRPPRALVRVPAMPRLHIQGDAMTAHGTTERDLAALTYLAGRLREETRGCGAWDQRGLEVKVAEFRNQNLAIVVEQILRHATDPEAKTPGALHRKFSPPTPSERDPVKRGNPTVGDPDECKLHGGQWADNCAGCKTDGITAYHDDDAQPLPHQPAHADASLARALRDATSRANAIREAVGWAVKTAETTTEPEETA